MPIRLYQIQNVIENDFEYMEDVYWKYFIGIFE